MPPGEPQHMRARMRHAWEPIDGLPWEQDIGYEPTRWRGDVLRARREAACLTSTELGAKFGVSAGTISAYERNDRAPSAGVVARFAVWFRCSFAAFFVPRDPASVGTVPK